MIIKRWLDQTHGTVSQLRRLAVGFLLLDSGLSRVTDWIKALVPNIRAILIQLGSHLKIENH